MPKARFERSCEVIAALMRVSFSEASAYRAENVIWLLATTMPLVMMSLFTSVAATEPLGKYDKQGFVTYFLCTFIVRTTTGSWASWQMNMDIRDGTLAVKLLRPIPPLWSYATDSLAALPLRGIVCIPVAIGIVLATGRHALTADPFMWGLWALAMVGSWMLNILTNLAIGSLAFFLESSVKVTDLYIACFFILSGYLIPIDVFPAAIAKYVAYLPFHFQLGLPVELMMGTKTRSAAAGSVAIQFAYVAAAWALTQSLFHRGLRKFAAYGG